MKYKVNINQTLKLKSAKTLTGNQFWKAPFISVENFVESCSLGFSQLRTYKYRPASQSSTVDDLMKDYSKL